MSDGGGVEVTVDNELKSNLGSGANQFGRSIARISVAQICQEVGLEGLSESALDSLSDIAIRYVFDLGKISRFYANLAGRTDCNVFDIIRGMEDLSLSQSVSGAFEGHSDCVVSSGVVKEIKEYVDSAEEIPFAQPVPHFPVFREKKLIPSFLQMGEVPSAKHIPAWLPAFPDRHTYVHTPVWNERSSDPRKDKVELARQRRKAESSLLSLQQRLVRIGSSISTSSTEPYDAENGFEFNETENSFLAKPLMAGERDISHVDQPVKCSDGADKEKRVPLLEAFAPAIEALKDGHHSGSDGEKKFPQRRTSALLEFKGGKKVFGESLDLRLLKKLYGKASSSLGQDEKDDKKRRVELILRQAMENQHEPPHM